METLIDINQAIISIGKLPELVMPKGVCFETPNEKQLIRLYKYFYGGLEAWLKHLVLHQTLTPEAIFTDWKHFQGHAFLDASLLNLITGLHPRLSILQGSSQGDITPVEIWFYAMAINCEICLTNSGILGKSSITGKVDYQEHNLALLERFNEHEIRLQPAKENPDKPHSYEIDFKECPTTFLNTLASELASQDEDFDKDYWQPYDKTVKRWTRKIRENKYLQAACLLPSGELFFTGENKKIPSSVRNPGNKGFRLK